MCVLDDRAAHHTAELIVAKSWSLEITAVGLVASILTLSTVR
jgi:hypothetical protein